SESSRRHTPVVASSPPAGAPNLPGARLSQSREQASPERWMTSSYLRARSILEHSTPGDFRMRTLYCAAAIAVGLSSGLLASIASAQDSATLKPFRDKSMIKIEYKAPADKKLEPIYQRLKAREALERLQAFLSPLRLPQPLNLVTAECGGQTELPYQPGAPVTICYEYVGLIEQAAPAGLGTVGQAVVTHDIAL